MATNARIASTTAVPTSSTCLPEFGGTAPKPTPEKFITTKRMETSLAGTCRTFRNLFRLEYYCRCYSSLYAVISLDEYSLLIGCGLAVLTRFEPSFLKKIKIY
jgi:hypothetical protein